MKSTFKRTLRVALVVTLILIIAILSVSTGSMKAFAATNRSGEYTLSGSYKVDNTTYSGYPSKFQIKISSEYFTEDTSTSVFYNGKVLNWTYFNFEIEGTGTYTCDHESFNLTRNGSEYYTRNLKGTTGPGVIAKGVLSDGDYVLTYVGKYTTSNVPHKYTFTYNFTVDTTNPSYSFTAGGTSIANASYTNKTITYSYSDSNPDRIYYLSPTASSYISTVSTSKTVSATDANNGWWRFYAEDDGGNYTSTVRVYLDTIAPVGTIKDSSGSTLSSGSYTNKPVKYTATDTGGISYLQVQLPNSSSWTSYASGTELSEYYGWYYFRAVDKAGNVSATLGVCYDPIAPTVTVYGGENEVATGGITNEDYIKFVPSDAHSGIYGCFVKKPGSSSYTSYSIGTELAGNGIYYFYCTDKAGNQSAYYSVTLDTTLPSAQLYVDGQKIVSGTYTNGEYIYFVSDGAYCYVKKPNGNGYEPYISGTEFSRAGRYYFYAVDTAGNSTATYSVVIDRTQKTVALSNIADGNTGGDVTATWTNGDAAIYAPISKVIVNGVAINNGSVIYTINTGNYKIEVTDEAGNTWSTSFTSTKKNILTDTLVREYYDVENVDGILISYESYDNALDFARSIENGYVTVGVWNGSSWDGGIAMDTEDSANAANGAYYIYKKSGSPDERVAYFTLDRLNKVIDEYAKERVETCYYWQKEPENIAQGEELYTDYILDSSVALGDNITAYLDEELIVGNCVEVEGFHTLTVKDNYGNSCDYNVTIVRSTPDVLYSVGNGSWNKADFSRVYYFKEDVSVTLNDEYDEMAFISVYDETEDVFRMCFKGDSIMLSESGTYTVFAVNHAGESEMLTIIISKNAPNATFTDDEEEKRLDIEIIESEDIYSHIQTMEILKSTDNGQTWQTVKVDDYGTEVSAQRLKYSFRTSGIYKIILTDEFRTGIDAVSVQYAYGQKAPAGILMGVENGGHTNGAVSFEWYDEAVVTVTKDGEVVKYRSSSDLREDGHYVITIENFDGMKNMYSFTIDTEEPTVSLNGVENGGTVNTDVSLDHADRAEIYKNGELMGEYASGIPITDEGEYRIVVSDLAGNATEVSFSIDKTAPVATLGGVDNGGTTKGKVTLIEPDEEVNVKVYFNDEEIEYVKGDKFTSAGAYKILVSDIYGNATEYNFEILKSANGAVIALIVIGVIAALGVVAVVVLKKKKLF